MRETQMKRSPHASSCSSSCNYAGFDNAPEKTVKPRTKRSKTNETPQTCELNNGNGNGTTSSSSNRRSSIYRGVTRHRWSGRFEAHLWDKSCWNNIQNKKGRQVYLGAYDSEETAARTYDLAALKYWGPGTTLNFPIEAYAKEVDEMDKLTREEYLATLRRQSSGFSRGVSKYRGVARHHHNGRWEARIGRVFGNKYLFLGTYNTQEEAAAAYDMAAIEYRGANAVTNFDISNYIDRLKDKIPSADKYQDTEIETETETETETESAPIPSTESEETVVDQLTKQPNTEQEQQLHSQPYQEILKEPKRERESTELEYNQMPHCVEESSMAVMESVVHSDHTWSFIDTGFTQFQVPLDMPLDKTGDLLDVFDDRGFEENIDFLFGLDSNENDFDLNKILEVEQNRGNASNSGENSEQEERSLSLSSPSSILSSSTCSPSSSTTSVPPVIILFEKSFEL